MPATSVVSEMESNSGQSGRRITEDAIRVADQLTRQRDPFVGGSTAEAESKLLLEVLGQRFSVTSGSTDLGRQPDSKGIVVEDSRVSRRHACFWQTEKGIAVVDLGSTNGTVIIRSGKRLMVTSEPVDLRLGDKVETLNGVPLAEVVSGRLS